MRWRKTAYLDIQPHKPNINITALNINAKYLSHTRILRDFQVKIKNKCKFQQSNIPMFKYGGDGALRLPCYLRAPARMFNHTDLYASVCNWIYRILHKLHKTSQSYSMINFCKVQYRYLNL